MIKSLFKPQVPSFFSVITVVLMVFVFQFGAPLQRTMEAKAIYDMNLDQIAAAIPVKALGLPSKEVPPIPKRNPFYRTDSIGIYLNSLPPQ